MTEEVFLYLVRGYHKTSLIPSSALSHHFLYRFAIVFDTLMQINSSPRFPSMFFADLLYEITLECKYTHLLVKTDTATIKINTPISTINSVDEFSLLAKESQPPEYIEFYRDSTLVCIMRSEMWVNAGGELPYADSYTLSFYTPIPMHERFHRVCVCLCAKRQATILETIEASMSPLSPPWWRRLFIWR